MPDVQAYYLNVGRAPGTKDVIDSGELSATRITGPVLDGATRYYVRLHTKVGGAWRFRDYEFQTAAIARVVAPTLTMGGVVPGSEFSWSRVQAADAYYLYIGRSPGQRDVVDTGELSGTSFRPVSLPGGELLHVRLWTKHGGKWRFVDESFTTAPVPSFISPRMGTIGAGQNLTLRWSSVRDADVYRVQLGTTADGSELFDSGEVSSTQVGPISVPQLPVVYGRVWARSGGAWRQGAVVFSTAPAVAAARLTHPQPLTTYSVNEGFRWRGNPLARHYRLIIGTFPGGNDVHDSGPIRSFRRFVDDLVPGVTYHATLITSYLSGATESTSIQFVGATGERTFVAKFEAVAQAAAEITVMASENFPAAGSLLESVTRLRNRYQANCLDYASALLSLVRDANIGVPARYVYVGLIPNAYDSHTLVEVHDTDTGRWLLVDPTFGVVPRDSLDGAPLTSAEMSGYTRNRDWTSVTYEYLSSKTGALLSGYYIDYPLLFAHRINASNGEPLEPVQSVIDLYDVRDGAVATSDHGLAARCIAEGDIVTVIADEVALDLECDGPDRQSLILRVPELALADQEGQSAELLELRRFVFE